MLPFIAGIAAGALGVMAFNRRDAIKERTKEGIEKAKTFADSGYEKTKEGVEHLKTRAQDVVGCLKSSNTEVKTESQASDVQESVVEESTVQEEHDKTAPQGTNA